MKVDIAIRGTGILKDKHMQRYNFDRKGMAQGIGVHATNYEEAICKAIKLQSNLFHENKLNACCPLIFRDNQPCISQCNICNPK